MQLNPPSSLNIPQLQRTPFPISDYIIINGAVLWGKSNSAGSLFLRKCTVGTVHVVEGDSESDVRRTAPGRRAISQATAFQRIVPVVD
jgi:hypothetical protein